MPTRRKRCLKSAGAEQTSNVLIKQKEERQAEDLANQKVEPDMEPLAFIKTEDDADHTNAEAHALQEFTPVPQTDEYLKTELMLDEEYIAELNDSEPTGKYDGLALADDQQIVAGISVKESATGELSSHIDSAKKLRKKRVAHPGRKWKCELCLKYFTSNVILRNHLKTHDLHRKRDFACDSCNKMFYSRNSMWNHKQAHRPRKHQCEVCSKFFTRKENLIVHMRRRHLNKAQSFTPAPQTAIINSINPHQIPNNTRTKEPTFACEICSRSFHGKDSVNKHLNKHYEDRQREFASDSSDRAIYTRYSYQCKVCGKRYARKGNLTAHMHKLHLDKTQSINPGPQTAVYNTINPKQVLKNTPTKETTFHDEVCLRSSEEKICLLRRHMSSQAQDGNQEIPFQSFESKGSRAQPGETHDCVMQKESRKEHMVGQHADEKPQTPNAAAVHTKTELISDEEFLDEDKVQGSQEPVVAVDDEHRTIVNIDAKDDKSCYPTKLIQAHMRLVHERTYECEVCQRCFRRERNLEKHLEWHAKHGGDVFACHICSKKLSTLAGLQLHLRRHTGDTFNCQVCGARYTKKSNLKVHMEDKHSDETQPFISSTQTPHDASAIISDVGSISDSEEASQRSATRTTDGQQGRLHILAETHTKESQELCEPTFKYELYPTEATKTELISDEEFIDEENDRDSVFQAEGSQQPAQGVKAVGLLKGSQLPVLPATDVPGASFVIVEDSVNCEVCHKYS